MQAEKLFERMLDDSKWGNGTELRGLAARYWVARQAGDEKAERALCARMDECKPVRKTGQTRYGGTWYAITRPDNGSEGRYRFKLTDEWDQLRTPLDANYFGLWANKAKQWIYTYAEDDICLEVYPDKTPDEFAEIAKLSQKWYFDQYYGPGDESDKMYREVVRE